MKRLITSGSLGKKKKRDKESKNEGNESNYNGSFASASSGQANKRDGEKSSQELILLLRAGESLLLVG